MTDGNRNAGSDDASGDGSADASTDGQSDATPACPFCDSTDVERESSFGSEISKTQFYCRNCSTVFERIKYDGDRPDTGR